MNVLSLFDGISCGRAALGAAPAWDTSGRGHYYASEVDKYCIAVAQKNFPDTIQLGDVREVDGADLPEIGLLLGGPPCQGLSFAGKRRGLEDPRSGLFWEFVRIKDAVRPEFFLMENVKMSKKNQDIISEALGVEPIMIDSALMAAQRRQRLYWTNIPGVDQPVDQYVTTAHVFSRRQPVDMKYHLSDAAMAKMEKYSKGYEPTGKAPTITTELAHGTGKNITPKLIKEIHAVTGEWRRATPGECEILQGLPEGYAAGHSDTQRYKMLGNCWTVPVISHILSYLP